VREVAEPVRVRARVVVDVRDDLAASRLPARVTRGAQALVFGGDHPKAVLARDVAAPVGRAVVDDDYLHLGVVDLEKTLARLPNRSGPVERADDHRDARPVARRGEGNLVECSGQGNQRRLRPAGAVSDAEGPVLDLVTTAVPLVRPREHERAGASGLEDRSDLPLEGCRLPLLAVPAAVQAHLREQERPIAGLVLQAGEVCVEPVAALQEDVHGTEVEKRELEVLRRRIVDIRDQAFGIRVLRRVVESLDEPLDPLPSVPADDGSGNLVADRVAEHGRVPCARRDAFSYALNDRAGAIPVLQKRDVLLPGDADEHTEPVLSGEVEEPLGWDGVRPDRVDTVLRHRGEVGRDHPAVVKLLALIVRTECPVRDATYVELLRSAMEKLPARLGACGRRATLAHRRVARGRWCQKRPGFRNSPPQNPPLRGLDASRRVRPQKHCARRTLALSLPL
jgi:hypothetical protein